jgi:hypothetical protein
MKIHLAAVVVLGLFCALSPSQLRAEDETHSMVIEFFNKSDIDVFVSSEGTSITDGDVDNGDFDLTKVVRKSGEYTAVWQIKLCPPDKTDGTPEVNKENQRYEIRVSYTDTKNGADDVTLCRATYRYDEEKKNSTGKKCTLRLYKMEGPDKTIVELNDLRGSGGNPLGEHQCVDEQNSTGPHVRSLIFKSTH